MEMKPLKIDTQAWNKSAKFQHYVALIFLTAISGVSCQTEPTDDPEGSQVLMGRGYGISSLTLFVSDLDSAQIHFTEVLGFSAPGPEMTEAGLIEGTVMTTFQFPDMSSIELLSLGDSVIVGGKDSVVIDYLDQFEGIGMYSLSSSSVDSTYSWLTTSGFAMDSVRTHDYVYPRPPSSDWYDDRMHIIKTSFETKRLPNHLPEFLEFSNFPYEWMRDWRSFYYMNRGFVQHPNGVVGVVAIKVVVEDLESARDDFRKMGFLEVADNPTEHMVRFKIKRNQELHLTTPLTPDDALAEFLKQHGSGVYAIVFEVKDLKETHDFLASTLPSDAATLDSLSNRITLQKEVAYGVQMEFIQEPEEQALLARQLNLNYGSKLDSTAAMYAKDMYVTYCALCHGDNREGYAADNAPSLRSQSLLATGQSSNIIKYAIQYGRPNTAMAGYALEQGGPLDMIEVELLLKWLSESSGVEEPLKLSREPVKGDVELGSKIYTSTCATCHGTNGEGITAPALGNPMLLATASDHFLRYAIAEGRDGTPMVAYKDSLSDDEIDAVTAFLRSRASGWDVPKPAVVSVPTPDQYVLNPDGMAPEFDLRDGLYVSAAQLSAALKEGRRFVLLDARSEVAWRQTHIPGAIPVPYYKEPETFVDDLPNDDTWIVAYCACPHAASGQVISTLRKYGFKNTAILDEGVLVWTQLGLPVQSGD